MQFRAWQLVTMLVRRMPLSISYLVAVWAGSVAFYCWPRGRRATVRNFSQVLRDAPISRVRKVARLSLVNYCRYLVDFVRFPSIAPAELIRQVEGEESFSALDRTLHQGRGAIIVSMHFGNWDLGAGATVSRGYPVAIVAETFSDPRLDAMVVGARQQLGMKVIKMEKAAPSLIRTLRQNGLLALLIDRPMQGEGVKVTFFGKDVEVPAGPARLALRTGATIVPVAFARKSPARSEVLTLADFSVAHEPTGNLEADVRCLTQQIMTAQEGFIRRYPEQWYMFREMWPTAMKRQTAS